MVCPTIWGKMTLARLQVRMTFFSERWFIISIFFSSFGAMKGPFFKDLDIVWYLYLFAPNGFSCFGGGQCICPSACSCESCNPGSVYPMASADRACRSAGGLRHHHVDGPGGTSQNRGLSDVHQDGACGLPCQA